MPEKIELISDNTEVRLDKFVAEKIPTLSRVKVRELIDGGFVKVNGKAVKPSYLLNTGDRIVAEIPLPPPSNHPAEHIPLKVIYEDEDLAVIDKPRGLTTHPAPGHPDGTLLNALLAKYPELAEEGGERPGIVHRLDKDTSGLMVVARSRQAQAALSAQFKERTVTKTYLVLVKGKLEPRSGIIEAAIGRHPANRKKMAVTEDGREAKSQYRVIQYYKGYTFVEVRIFTGRTHQIRVHLAAIGFPVVGDETYGMKSELFLRQFVHSHRLGFKQPKTDALLSFTSELAPDLAAGLAKLSPLS
ncbi:RluA family pseudouridine synthase [Dehalogenimonas etheniformans]|uniref:Pseudouridine synthase n=1 Tax=Dehalogenimonas etheniformans TaxID=1536648 RepID=A0A2P5P7G8_9CHLR|nr:RluA family pseudouridine synthase [Dehalogenimonas etheniformans]PPD58230.1 RluA family pseudouridine synthase [Dehalogenimonas etheniformans]QNT75639.1 RluA family pseudouridine synthase [Dehalogenimonas etheniformans]